MAEEFIAHLSQLTDTGPQREEANEYFAAVKQENPLFYLTSIADFVNQLEEETPETETLVIAALILLCDILKEKPEQGFNRILGINS